MTEAEFREWQQYAATRMLPARRIELHLAQIAMYVARASGVVWKSIDDFLFELPGDDDDDVEASADDARAFFGFNPIK